MGVAAERLDSRAVVLRDRFLGRDGEECQPEEGEAQHRVEIVWATQSATSLEWAQLLCGQWSWCYHLNSNTGDPFNAVALVLDDVDEVLEDHDLVLPDPTASRQLDVVW